MSLRNRIGVDLGQATDNTAVAAVEIVGQDFEVRQIARLPLGLPYVAEEGSPSVAASVRQMALRMQEIDAANKLRAEQENFQRTHVHSAILPSHTPLVVVDGTGVGVAVVDIFRMAFSGADIPIRVVEIAAGTDKAEKVKAANGMRYVRVGKEYLVAHLTGLMQARRIRSAQTPEFAETVEQLKAFERRTNAQQHDTYGAKSGAHDDLVIALALAVLDPIPGDSDQLAADSAKLTVREMNPERLGGVTIHGWHGW